jgi:predicted metal-binding membrane protein
MILKKIAFLSSMMEITSPLLGATILLAAEVFQFTSLKNKCLTECRSPMGFLVSEWRDGIYGAFLMGIRHGYFCVGCCWMLMALLFVTGVMNLMWVAAIALFVLIEKVLPYPQWTGRIAGILLILWGLMMLVRTSIF